MTIGIAPGRRVRSAGRDNQEAIRWSIALTSYCGELGTLRSLQQRWELQRQ
jgi:hypothetical protein